LRQTRERTRTEHSEKDIENGSVVSGIFQLKHHFNESWGDKINFREGFNCEMQLNPRQGIVRSCTFYGSTVSAESLGINSSFEMTAQLYGPLNILIM